jgi:hypothetical protein
VSLAAVKIFYYKILMFNVLPSKNPRYGFNLSADGKLYRNDAKARQRASK